MRTWAVWQGSRWILAFLIISAIVGNGPQAVSVIPIHRIVEGLCGARDRDNSARHVHDCWYVIPFYLSSCDFDTLVDVKVVPIATTSTTGSMQQCRVSLSAVTRAWVVPYIGIMMFEVGSSHLVSSLSDMADPRQLC
jgi:hypothetical protein